MAFVGSVDEVLSTRTIVVVPSALSPEPHNLVSPHATSLLQAALPSLTRFLCSGPVRGSLDFLQPPVSLWQTESSLIFTARWYVGSSQLWCCELGSPAWDETPRS